MSNNKAKHRVEAKHDEQQPSKVGGAVKQKEG
jgi:hypothetical protein